MPPAGDGQPDVRIVRAVGRLAEALALEIVAEGVELGGAGGAAARPRLRRRAGLPLRAAARRRRRHRGRARLRRPERPNTVGRMSTVSPEALGRVPLLSGLDARQLARLAEAMRERTFRAGTEATREGGGGVGFFIVLDGAAHVTVGRRGAAQARPERLVRRDRIALGRRPAHRDGDGRDRSPLRRPDGVGVQAVPAGEPRDRVAAPADDGRPPRPDARVARPRSRAGRRRRGGLPSRAARSPATRVRARPEVPAAVH